MNDGTVHFEKVGASAAANIADVTGLAPRKDDK